MVCASAALEPKIVIFFKAALGINILEGYAQTETGCEGTLSFIEDNTLGHVGGPKSILKIRLRDVPDLNYYHTDQPNSRGEI